MSDLQSLLKNLTASAVSAISYVYYDKETGRIHKISSKNIAEEGFEVFEIENDEVKPILTGERRIEEFIIKYDISLKQIRLKEVAYDDTYNTASTMCYQLPITKGRSKISYVKDYTHEITFEPRYTGIYVDVWYEELSHLAGQHVWINDNVYRLVEDQSANTKFTIGNAELVVNDVKLYSDKNKTLKIDNTILSGDLILKNNKIFTYRVTEEHLYVDNDIVIHQDTENNIWKIGINPHIKNFIIRTGYAKTETLYFSVTEKHDPNILYRSLEFTIADLLSQNAITIPFIFDSERKADNVSIYTAKYFDSYVHEVI